MKNTILIVQLFTLLVLFVKCSSEQSNEISIIPKPESVKILNGKFILNSKTKVQLNIDDTDIKNMGSYLVRELKNLTGLELEIADGKELRNHSNTIQLLLTDSNKELGKEGYLLNISKSDIILEAHAHNGIFYAIQSLLQILDADQLGKVKDEWKLQACSISDKPRFSWRGMHLDVSRRFYSVEFIKKYLDYLAMNKLNVFHWHLTEDQGWRIEIKKYPKLTGIGSVRKETSGDGIPHRGFYTQENIKEVLEYAKQRYITVVPEIELPGHSVAALAAYPEISCTGGPFEVETRWGIFKDVYCAGNEQTFIFLQEVLDEVIDLFPSEYIHIGGDEVPKDRWEKCKKCQHRIKEENLADEHELQSYFINRIEKYINNKGKKIIGWDEILEGGLAPNATVMSWQGEEGGIKAAQLKHEVIMSPNSHLYFNYFQGNPEFEPNTIGRKLTLSKVYSYNPTPPTLTKEESNYIIGAQACLWSERISDSKEAEYLIFPRLAALAELVWTKQELRNIDDFMSRLSNQFKRYDFYKINYAKSVLDVYSENKCLNDERGISVELKTEMNRSKIYYTTNGSVPNEKSELYVNPILISDNTKLRAIPYFHGEKGDNIFEEDYVIHKAFKKNIQLKHEFSDRYDAGEYALTNGLKGSASYGDGRWKAILFNDLEAIIDLGEITDITEVTCGFLHFPDLYIFAPDYVEYYVSDDGSKYKQVNKTIFNKSKDPMAKTINFFTHSPENLKARYVKVVAKNIGYNPEWHKTAGEKSWLFVDEIIIN